MSDAGHQLCTFDVDGDLFGLDVGIVQEVLCDQPLTTIPLAPDGVAGLMNLRGQIVPVVDLRTRLGIAPRPERSPGANVIIRADDGPVSILVDSINGVIETSPDCFEPPPATLAARHRHLVRSIGKLDDRLVHLLDATGALETDDTDTAITNHHKESRT